MSGRSRAGAIALVASVCAALSCGRGDDGAVTLRFWAMGSEGELVPQLLAGFEREHPDIHVAVQQLPWTSAHEKLLTAYVGEATPDVAQLGNTWIAELAALDALTPLGPALASSSTVKPDDYFAGIWATNQIDGQLYGVPWYVDTRLIFYRRDLFAGGWHAGPPSNWDQWLASLRAVKRRVGDHRYAILLPLDEFDQLLSLALETGDPLIRDGRWGNFRSAGFRRALAFYLQLFVEQLAPIATQVEVSNAWEELQRGYFASLLHGPWSVGELRRRWPADMQDQWATAVLPGPSGPGGGIAGGASLVVFRRAEHPKAAWQLIEYLSRPDIQRQMYALTGDLPPRRSSWDAAALAGDPQIQAFRAQLEHVTGTPPLPEWERIVTEMRILSERAVRQTSPNTTPEQLAAIVDAMVSELDRRTDQLLEKRRWILDRVRSAR